MLLWPYNKYPGTDYETFNWEWILKTVKEWTAKMTEAILEWAAMKIDWQNFIDHTYKDQITEILEDHPEWVTTVQNGSITAEKLQNYFLLSVENDYVTPQMYGAAADGVTDDTQAIQDAIDAAYDENKKLFFPGAKYLVTDTLYLPRNLTIEGINNADYTNQSWIVADFGNVDKKLFDKKPGVANLAHFNIHDMVFVRRRTAIDGYDEDLTPYATGKMGICFPRMFNETHLRNITMIGWGVAMESAPLSWITGADFKYCEKCVNITGSVTNDMHLSNFNIWKCGSVFDINTNCQNITLSDSWIESVSHLITGVLGARQINGLTFNKVTLANNETPGNAITFTQRGTTFSRVVIRMTNCNMYINGDLFDSGDAWQSADVRLLANDNIFMISGTLGGSNKPLMYGSNMTFTLTGGNKDSMSNSGFDSLANNINGITKLTKTSNSNGTEGFWKRSGMPAYTTSGGTWSLLPIWNRSDPGVQTPSPDPAITRTNYFIYNIAPNNNGDYILAYIHGGTDVQVLLKRE